MCIPEKLKDGFTFAYIQRNGKNKERKTPNIVAGSKKMISSFNYFVGYELVATVNVTTDDDYEICKAHADYDGILFIGIFLITPIQFFKLFF